jgi:hypothetical protein
MPKKMSLDVQVDLEDLVYHMSDFDNETLIEFVQALDERVGEWDFTVKLRDYFNGINYIEVDN